MESTQLRQKQKEYVWPCTSTYYQEPLVVAEGRGLRLKDAEGREFLDFFGGILTVSLGHGIPEITRAIEEQVHRFLHTSTLYVAPAMVELAEKLAQACPGEIKQCFFTPSGTDADETAIMVAQLSTGRQEIVALRHAYSGRSFVAQAVTAHSPWRCVSTQVPFVKHAHAPYCYRCDFGLTYPACELRCATDVEMLIRTTTQGQVAAFIAEPIQGVGGFIVPPPEYFKVVVDIVRRAGGLFICDEVQTGFGRTGHRMWGIEHFGVQPDIMTMAKGIANGLPLGATVTRPEIAAAVRGLSISTFGGNPVSCAAAVATLQYLHDHQLAEKAGEVGALLADGLRELQRRFPRLIGDVRGMGLMQGLELVVDEQAGNRAPNPQATLALFEATKRRGLLIGKGGLFGNVIRLAPPMTASRTDVEEALGILEQSLVEITAPPA